MIDFRVDTHNPNPNQILVKNQTQIGGETQYFGPTIYLLNRY